MFYLAFNEKVRIENGFSIESLLRLSDSHSGGTHVCIVCKKSFTSARLLFSLNSLTSVWKLLNKPHIGVR